MGPPDNRPKNGTKGFMDLIIYNEESDRHVRITWEQALKATLASNGANLEDKTNTTPGPVPCNITGWLAAAKALNKANKSGSEADIGAVYGNPFTRAYIVIARPFIEHLMHSAVVAVAGRDTGATLFGPADMQISANTQVKTIEG